MTYKVIGKYIKNLDFEIPNPKVFSLLSKNISNYKINIDIKSNQLKNRIIEVETTLNLTPNKTEIEKITTFLNEIDLVVVMTVIPGFGGQKFLYDQVSKIKKLCELRQSMKANFEIEIDGGINKETSKICVENGADVLVAGSYIYGSPEIEYKQLINAIR